jgi:hypothetical protein
VGLVQCAERGGLGRRPLTRQISPSFDQVCGARSGLFDAIGHIDVVKRYLCRVGRRRGGPKLTTDPAQ